MGETWPVALAQEAKTCYIVSICLALLLPASSYSIKGAFTYCSKSSETKLDYISLGLPFSFIFLRVTKLIESSDRQTGMGKGHSPFYGQPIICIIFAISYLVMTSTSALAQLFDTCRNRLSSANSFSSSLPASDSPYSQTTLLHSPASSKTPLSSSMPSPKDL